MKLVYNKLINSFSLIKLSKTEIDNLILQIIPGLQLPFERFENKGKSLLI